MSTTTQHDLEMQKVEQFGEKLIGILNGGALALMLSLGHRTGLFDAMADQPAMTTQELADKTNLNERYIREWLGAMVTGGMITYDPASKTYALPPEHAALLTRTGVAGNMAATMQWVGVLGQVEDEVLKCFKEGGGVHYCCYSRFHEVMAEESAQTVVAALNDHILPLVPDLLEQLESGIQVMDVGCGAGRAMIRMAEMFPNSHFTGYDFSEQAIGRGNAEAASKGLTNVELVVRDVSQIGDREKFDLITAFDAIHDQRDPAGVLVEIRNALKPTGTFLMQDIHSSSHLEKNMSNPISSFLYTISCMHCMTVSLALDGAGLGTCWGEELACQMLDEAGFGKVRMQQLDHDIINTYYVCQKS